jgi:hypothetical protein
MINKKKSLYIGGGFLESQLLWILPVAKGLIKKKKINLIIIEKLVGKIVTPKYISKIFPNCEIIVIKNSSFLKKYLQIFLFSLKNFLQIFKYYYYISNKNIFSKRWTELQLRHSIWDSALNMMKDSQANPSKFHILYSIILSLNFFYKAKDLAEKYSIKIAILGHSVYQHRSFLAQLRQKKIQILSHASYNLHWQKHYDVSWSIINVKFFKKIEKIITKSKIEKYWNKRFLGYSNYEDANVAAKISNKSNIYPKNVILLHIFKDSPFNIIDKNRIFTDYFDWVNSTLKILLESGEKWSIRLHPNSNRWGENQKIIIKMLLSKHPDLLKKILLIDENLVSNNYLFKNVKRIVTFSGTSHVEAACAGIKPIVISQTSLSALNSNIVLKPKNFNQYKKFILDSSDSKIFKQTKKSINFSKKILYIRENLLSLKKDLGGINIYRRDGYKIRYNELKNIHKNLNSNLKNLEFLGEKLSDGLTHSISNKYLRQL